jgi:DNA-binding response OmpR family regulator
MMTILLVEDSLTDAEMVSQYLKRAGLSVISVTNCKDARSKLTFQKPDLVILDVILPGQSGFEFCRELKSSSATRHIPVVICSTKGTEADKLWGTMLGADAYLAKPINQNDLTTTVLRLIA